MPPVSYTICYLAAVGAGISVALQQVLNANLRNQIDSPWWAGFVSYFVGALIMLPMALASPAPRLSGSFGRAAPSWLSWSGGIFGAIFIAIAIFMVPRLGAATVLALVVVGQMLASLVFDHFGLLGLPQHPASPIRLFGTALLILAVILIRT